MSLSAKYVHFPGIVVVLGIVGTIGPSFLTPAAAAPDLMLDPSSGSVGETIRAEGSGFTPVISIEILFNGEQIPTSPPNIRTNISGEFEAEFLVPETSAGDAVVTARGELLDNSATAEFEVLNNVPVTEDLAESTNEDSPLPIELPGVDANDDDLIFSIVENPAHGTLTGLDEESGTVTYVPNNNYYGDDAFSFKVNDGFEDSNTSEVSIDIFPVNDPPYTANQELSVEQNGEASITLEASDVDGDELTYSIVDEPASGTLTGNPPDLVYQPMPDFSGSDRFSFVANDGEANSNISGVDVNVTPVNNAPSAADSLVETNEDEPVTVILTADDDNDDSDNLTFAIMSQPSHGTLGQITPVNSASASVTYTPEADYNGEDSFTFSVSDGDESSNVAEVSITVRAVNDAPVSSDQSLTAAAGQSTEIILTGIDPDGDDLVFDIVEDPLLGSLGPVVSATGTSATVSYTPDSGQAGSDNFTFRANDGSLYSNTATVSIVVSAPDSSGDSSDNSPDVNPSGGTASDVAGNDSPDSSGAGGVNGNNNNNNDSPGSDTNIPSAPAEVERSINDELSIQEEENDGGGGIEAQGSGNGPTTEGLQVPEGISSQALQSLATDTVENNPFMNGPAAWLLPGAIAGLVSVVAFLGYRERKLKKGYTDLQEKTIDPPEQPELIKESAQSDETRPHKIQDRIASIVSMNRIYRILENEKGTVARERILDVEYGRSPASRAEYENSRSIVKNQFDQIGAILQSNPQLKESFMESYGDLAIKVWWAIKQDVQMDRRRGRYWESLEWLGSEVEKYWSTQGRTSSS